MGYIDKSMISRITARMLPAPMANHTQEGVWPYLCGGRLEERDLTCSRVGRGRFSIVPGEIPFSIENKTVSPESYIFLEGDK